MMDNGGGFMQQSPMNMPSYQPQGMDWTEGVLGISAFGEVGLAL